MNHRSPLRICRPIHPRYQIIGMSQHTIYWQCPLCGNRGILREKGTKEAVNTAWLQHRTNDITAGGKRKRDSGLHRPGSIITRPRNPEDRYLIGGGQ